MSGTSFLFHFQICFYFDSTDSQFSDMFSKFKLSFILPLCFSIGKLDPGLGV